MAGFLLQENVQGSNEASRSAMTPQNIIRRFRSAQGSVNLFALEGRPAVELLSTNPLAGFCLAVNERLTTVPSIAPLSTARRYMVKPQREILGWLGFQPASEAIAKIGRKCVPEALNLDLCRRFRGALRNEKVRELLAHTPRINAGVMALVCDTPLLPYLSHGLLQEVSRRHSENSRSETAEVLRDVYELDRELEHRPPQQAFRSIRQVQERHQELIEEINKCGGKNHRSRLFPPPPIQGLKTLHFTVTPITTVGALQALGRSQRNCVASHAGRISKGKYYVYCVFFGQKEYTLALSQTPFGKWEMSELKGHCNTPAPGSLIRLIDEWLKRHQQQQKPETTRRYTEAKYKYPSTQLSLLD